MGENPYTNPTVKPLVLPAFGNYGIDVNPQERGHIQASDT